VLEFWSPRVRRMERSRDIAGIIDALGKGNPRTRRAAANALIRIPDPRSAGLLVQALSSDDPLLRRNAAIALGEVLGVRGAADEPAIEAALVEALGDSDASVRAMAVASLGRTRPAAAIPALVGLLDDGRRPVRVLATIVLRGYDDPRATEALSR
jgi:HEAT repeat protein